MSLVMIDFDWFAAVNKRHGHQTGDAVLRRGAALVRDQVGSRGSCFRYGGEELAVLLPDHAEPEAARVAQEIRQAMSERDDDLPAVTVSCGVACTAPEVSPWDLVERADQALLLAKRCGRNQVMTVDALRDAAAGSAEAQDASVTAARRAALDLATVTLSVHAHATADHSEEVVVLCAALAGRLAIPGDERRVLLDAARLHDIGKIAVAPSILNKPGPLSEEEWKIMREHTPAGERILRSVPEMAEVAVAVRHAHEHFDGTGYPDGLAGEAIPLASRIILCADAFHAIREDRPYRHGASAVAAMTEIQAHAGTQFDPRVVEALGHIQSGRRLAHPAPRFGKRARRLAPTAGVAAHLHAGGDGGGRPRAPAPPGRGRPRATSPLRPTPHRQTFPRCLKRRTGRTERARCPGASHRHQLCQPGRNGSSLPGRSRPGPASQRELSSTRGARLRRLGNSPSLPRSVAELLQRGAHPSLLLRAGPDAEHRYGPDPVPTLSFLDSGWTYRLIRSQPHPAPAAGPKWRCLHQRARGRLTFRRRLREQWRPRVRSGSLVGRRAGERAAPDTGGALPARGAAAQRARRTAPRSFAAVPVALRRLGAPGGDGAQRPARGLRAGGWRWPPPRR